MKNVVLVILMLGMRPLAAEEAPWEGERGEQCFAQWERQAINAMNTYSGSPEFNRRKPWRIDQFGRLRGQGDPANYPPKNYGRYDENRYQFMWDYYEYALRKPGTGWLMPEMEAAGVPPLRAFVRQCRRGTRPAPEPERPETFFEPTVGNYRVDWCLHWASGCGEPAANRFCREQGFEAASLWEIEIDIAARTPTYILGDDRTCNLPSCDGFRFIACRSEPAQDDEAPLEVGYQRYGADYRVFTPSPASAEGCQSACQAEERCQAWTFEAFGGEVRCRLKHSVTPATPAACCTSGVRNW